MREKPVPTRLPTCGVTGSRGGVQIIDNNVKIRVEVMSEAPIR
jgi:hypothetical protein